MDVFSGVHELSRLVVGIGYAFGKRKAATAGTNNSLYLPTGRQVTARSCRTRSGSTIIHLLLMAFSGIHELARLVVGIGYGARFYDPVIGRWNSVDPLAERTSGITPYAHGDNSPISMVDNDGRYAVSVHYYITYRSLLSLGYYKKEADLMAHYSSTYADHPSMPVLHFDYLLHGGGKNPNLMNYRNGINYSATKLSQDESNSAWHSMMSDAEAESGMTKREALFSGLKFGWDNIFASEGGKDLGKYGQGMHALQDAVAHQGAKTNSHLGANRSSINLFYNDMYGNTEKAGALTRSAGIVARLMAGKKVEFKKNEELNFQGMSSGQLAQTLNLLLQAGFSGTIKTMQQ